MKKAIAAGVLLAMMLGAAFWNTGYLDRSIEEMAVHIEQCKADCREGHLDTAEEELSAASALWERIGLYAHIFLRQTETDSVEEALRDVHQYLHAADAETAQIALDWLEHRLLSMLAMERISLESVF